MIRILKVIIGHLKRHLISKVDPLFIRVSGRRPYELFGSIYLEVSKSSFSYIGVPEGRIIDGGGA